jgi:hypothetical protein
MHHITPSTKGTALMVFAADTERNSEARSCQLTSRITTLDDELLDVSVASPR